MRRESEINRYVIISIVVVAILIISLITFLISRSAKQSSERNFASEISSLEKESESASTQIGKSVNEASKDDDFEFAEFVNSTNTTTFSAPESKENNTTNTAKQSKNIVTNNTDYTIFTSDNPRYEEPESIIEDMTKNIKTNNYEIVINRKEAIKKGVNLLKDEDILIILGKGKEEYQIIGNDEFTHSDYKEVMKNTKGGII